jgi:beta-phosphoglucomutase-like phosphatase (HAD superfamily)
MKITRVERLIKKHGTLNEFRKAIWYAYDTLMINEAEAIDGIRKYVEELKAAQTLDETKIINFKDLKKRLKSL